MKCCSETMFRDSTPPSLCLLSAANDPQTGIDPQIGPQMIPLENEEWRGIYPSGRGFNFNINRSKS